MTPDTALSDRELMVSRLIEGPRDVVFEAFTEVQHLSRCGGQMVSPPQPAPSSSRRAESGSSPCMDQTEPTTRTGSNGWRSGPLR